MDAFFAGLPSKFENYTVLPELASRAEAGSQFERQINGKFTRNQIDYSEVGGALSISTLRDKEQVEESRALLRRKMAERLLLTLCKRIKAPASLPRESLDILTRIYSD